MHEGAFPLEKPRSSEKRHKAVGTVSTSVGASTNSAGPKVRPPGLIA